MISEVVLKFSLNWVVLLALVILKTKGDLWSESPWEFMSASYWSIYSRGLHRQVTCHLLSWINEEPGRFKLLLLIKMLLVHDLEIMSASIVKTESACDTLIFSYPLLDWDIMSKKFPQNTRLSMIPNRPIFVQYLCNSKHSLMRWTNRESSFNLSSWSD